MDWKNTEQFQDYTAGEAMCLAMLRDPERAGAVDNGGFRQLAASVVLQAVQDYRNALRGIPFRFSAEEDRAELEDFCRSGWCRGFLRFDGRRLMLLVREEVDKE